MPFCPHIPVLASLAAQPPLMPLPPLPQSVLGVILAGDRQWLLQVSTVAGVVVLRTLLQVRRAVGVAGV